MKSKPCADTVVRSIGSVFVVVESDDEDGGDDLSAQGTVRENPQTERRTPAEQHTTVITLELKE